MLAGSYDHRIDSKSRLVLPSAARPAFANGGFASDQGGYIGLFPTQEWQEFIAKGAFNNVLKTGEEFKTWLAGAHAEHASLMERAGFLAN